MAMTTALSPITKPDTTSGPAQIALGTLEARTPADLVAGAARVAHVLADVIKQNKLSVRLSGREFVRCEGWTTLGALLGVMPHVVSIVEADDGVFIARVELRRMSDGMAIGSAEAECGAADEVDAKGRPTWASRPRYAKRAMAQTRATSRVCRQCFGWVMALSGYETTPAEEVEPLTDVTPVTAPSTSTARRVVDARTDDDDTVGGRPITDAQRRRFYALTKQHGWTEHAVRALLEAEGIAASAQITRHEYDALCARLAQGPPSTPDDEVTF